MQRKCAHVQHACWWVLTKVRAGYTGYGRAHRPYHVYAQVAAGKKQEKSVRDQEI